MVCDYERNVGDDAESSHSAPRMDVCTCPAGREPSERRMREPLHAAARRSTSHRRGARLAAIAAFSPCDELG
nr:hypothetical protein CFP56_67592 [Quercus suber]